MLKSFKDQFLKGCILKGNFLTAIPPSLHFAFQDDYSYEFFWMIKEFFLVNIDFLLCVIEAYHIIPSYVHVCCHVRRTMQAKLEAI